MTSFISREGIWPIKNENLFKEDDSEMGVNESGWDDVDDMEEIKESKRQIELARLRTDRIKVRSKQKIGSDIN
ncbi:4541_t:CDS:2 [Entrophospora sp. SA101]|nr:4541_t:CDS:2 [Entrophospora sp. SA101]